MPDKQLTVATYAAGASLAAITLVYVFAPTFFIDEQSVGASASSRKKGVVGLSNPANDCFINSVLQSLASLGDLRLYLIREVHRRTLDGPEIYKEAPENHSSKSSPSWKIEGLQQGLVTQGLKEILDALNERPLQKKTISASGFVVVLEKAFRQRISRHQQDAQEFLQVVAERLNDEYHAGAMARQRAKAKSLNLAHPDGISSSEKIDSATSLQGLLPKPSELPTAEHREDWSEETELPVDGDIHPDLIPVEEEGFPLEGTTEAQVECLTCGFKPRSTETTFCTLTVNVPQVQSTSLSSCFDGIFKTEHIDDFKCEKCRLIHALSQFEEELSKADPEKRTLLETTIERLKQAIKEDPENPPTDIELPDSKFAPKRKIARHVRIVKFPKVLAIHLSRSIFDFGQSSMKNSAKVAFPERLPMGGLVDRRHYKLLAMTTHKGSHQSGHYETFRRQASFPAFSTPNALNPNGAFHSNHTRSSLEPMGQPSSPVIFEEEQMEEVTVDSHTQLNVPRDSDETKPPALPETPISPSPEETSLLESNSTSPTKPTNTHTKERISTDSHHSTRSNLLKKRFSKISHRDSEDEETSSISSSIKKGLKKVGGGGGGEKSPLGKGKETKEQGKFRRRKRKLLDRWWRISDEKVKESKTSEVLGMQKEVYLLFYELER